MIQICLGGEVPEQYYMGGNTHIDKDNFQNVEVGSGTTLPICMDVKTPGSILKLVPVPIFDIISCDSAACTHQSLYEITQNDLLQIFFLKTIFEVDHQYFKIKRRF